MAERSSQTFWGMLLDKIGGETRESEKMTQAYGAQKRLHRRAAEGCVVMLR